MINVFDQWSRRVEYPILSKLDPMIYKRSNLNDSLGENR